MGKITANAGLENIVVEKKSSWGQFHKKAVRGNTFLSIRRWNVSSLVSEGLNVTNQFLSIEFLDLNQCTDVLICSNLLSLY